MNYMNIIPIQIWGTCPLIFLNKVDFECSFKNKFIICIICLNNHTGVIIISC